MPGELQHARGRTDDVDAGGHDPPDIVHRLRQSGVSHGAVDGTLRSGRQQCVQLVGGGDPGDGPQSGEFAGVLADLSSLDTQTAVSSKAGLAISSASASRPTFPVPICATRMAMGFSMGSGRENWNRF